jgi:peptide/nickel transport system permease protein
MRQFIIKRILVVIPLILGITFITYLIMDMAPVDPLSIYVDPTIGGSLTPEELDILRKSLGLDKSVWTRYILWLGRAVRGDLGYSFLSNRPVIKEIGDRIGNTLILTGTSLVMSLIFGILIGIYSALNKYKFSDYVISVLAFLGVSIPTFWFGMMMMLVFTSKLGWLPSVGMASIVPSSTSWGRFIDLIKHLIMPSMVLSLTSIATWARYQRSSMLEVLEQDYIRTARSKGLTERMVVFDHALRNAALPVITLLGMSLSNLVGGAFIVESIFAWPGMGRLGVTSIFTGDYPVVMGVTLFS